MIFFIYGTDHFRCRQKLNELIEQFKQKRDQSGLNIVRFTADNLDSDQFRQEIMTRPFLGEKKMIIVQNAVSHKKIGPPIFDFLKNSQPDNIAVFLELLDPENKKTPGDAFFHYLQKQKYAWEFNRLKNRELKTWLKNFLAAQGASAEPAALSELAMLVGGDLNQLSLEAAKLIAYKNGQPISRDDVQELVQARYDDNIFGLVDAIGQKNKKTAIKLATGQLKSGAHPLTILNMVARQFRILIQVKNSPTNRLGLHPFVFSKTKSQSQNFSEEKLREIYRELMMMEKQFKNGAKNPELLFDFFIAKNC